MRGYIILSDINIYVTMKTDNKGARLKNQRFFTFYLNSIASAAYEMQGDSVKESRGEP